MITERRTHKRLNLTLPVRLNDHRGSSENISTSGVYLNVEADDVDKFLQGKNVEVEVTATISEFGLSSRTIGLATKGVVIRTEKIGAVGDRTKLGVALEFVEKLKFMPEYF